VHIVELSTAVVKVDTKVIQASLTQNQCLQCVPPASTHVEIPRLRDATELNNDGMIKMGEFDSIFLINDDSSFCSRILLAVDLQCHVFPLKSYC